MGPTLTMASELGAYTLTDRGTWLAYQSKLDLAVLLEGDKRLFNPYQVILVNPKRYQYQHRRGPHPEELAGLRARPDPDRQLQGGRSGAVCSGCQREIMATLTPAMTLMALPRFAERGA